MLSKRTRIDVYVPERKDKIYGRLRQAFETEFVFAFGGCTVIHGLKGLYLGSSGSAEQDAITRIYSDIPLNIDEHREEISAYADAIRSAAAEALPEESILVTIESIYHSV